MSTVTERWVELFRSTPYDALPADVIAQAKLALLDYLGVALGGADMPISRLGADYYTGLGGREEASAYLTPRRLPAIHAAMVNGVYGHALDMDDGHRAAAGHPGVATLPAALAAAERADSSGPELLRAMVFGYEVFVRLGGAINPAHLRRGFHTTATVSPFAAAVAVATLLDLGAEASVRALGLAGVQGAGLLEVFHDGAMAKPFQVARGSAAGLLAADLAARGAEGPRAVLEGSQGFLSAVAGGGNAARLTADLGDDWAVRGVYFKEHAACRHTHAAVDAAAHLAREHRLTPDDVESVLVRTYDVAHRLCGSPKPPAGISEAKFSLGYTVALGLTVGHARQSCFTPAMIADPVLRELGRRVRVEVDPAIEALYPGRRSATLAITTRDGRHLREEVPIARGEPELPLTPAEIEAKFLDNATAPLGEAAAHEVVMLVKQLDRAASVRPLLDRLAGRVPAPAAV